MTFTPQKLLLMGTPPTSNIDLAAKVKPPPSTVVGSTALLSVQGLEDAPSHIGEDVDKRVRDLEKELVALGARLSEMEYYLLVTSKPWQRGSLASIDSESSKGFSALTDSVCALGGSPSVTSFGTLTERPVSQVFETWARGELSSLESVANARHQEVTEKLEALTDALRAEILQRSTIQMRLLDVYAVMTSELKLGERSAARKSKRDQRDRSKADAQPQRQSKRGEDVASKPVLDSLTSSLNNVSQTVSSLWTSLAPVTKVTPNVSSHVFEVSEAEPPSPVSSDSLTVQFARFQSELKRQHEAFLESGKIAELCESPRSCAAIFEYHMEQQESAERRKTMEAQSVAKPFDQF